MSTISSVINPKYSHLYSQAIKDVPLIPKSNYKMEESSSVDPEEVEKRMQAWLAPTFICLLKLSGHYLVEGKTPTVFPPLVAMRHTPCDNPLLHGYFVICEYLEFSSYKRILQSLIKYAEMTLNSLSYVMDEASCDKIYKQFDEYGLNESAIESWKVAVKKISGLTKLEPESYTYVKCIDGFIMEGKTAKRTEDKCQQFEYDQIYRGTRLDGTPVTEPYFQIGVLLSHIHIIFYYGVTAPTEKLTFDRFMVSHQYFANASSRRELIFPSMIDQYINIVHLIKALRGEHTQFIDFTVEHLKSIDDFKTVEDVPWPIRDHRKMEQSLYPDRETLLKGYQAFYTWKDQEYGRFCKKHPQVGHATEDCVERSEFCDAPSSPPKKQRLSDNENP